MIKLDLEWKDIRPDQQRNWKNLVQEADALLNKADMLFGWIEDKNGMLKAAQLIMEKYSIVVRELAIASPQYIFDFRKEVIEKRDNLEKILRKMIDMEGSTDSFLSIFYRHLRLCCQAQAIPIVIVPDKQSGF